MPSRLVLVVRTRFQSPWPMTLLHAQHARTNLQRCTTRLWDGTQARSNAERVCVCLCVYVCACACVCGSKQAGKCEIVKHYAVCFLMLCTASQPASYGTVKKASVETKSRASRQVNEAGMDGGSASIATALFRQWSFIRASLARHHILSGLTSTVSFPAWVWRSEC